jgi:tRNA(Arg) A34 adenosine deaminase TadA
VISRPNLNKKLEMLVIRTDKAGRLKNSKPCSHCLATLKMFGIKIVYYSTDEGTIEKHKIDTLDTEHYSGGQKKYYRLLGKEEITR